MGSVTARLMAAVIAVAVASCAAIPTPPAPTSTVPPVELPAPASQFQQWLDASAIGYTVPATGKAILVNIPAFELIAFEDALPVWRSRVIVGTLATPTPRLTLLATAVRFRPTWRPTPSMLASGEYVDRLWPPGPNNPLGLAAVQLEPLDLLIYMHDTNRRDLFDRPQRALSHGCIRVQRWDELAAWLLDEDLETVRGWAEGRRTFDVPIAPVPVTLGYFTAFPDDDGQVLHFADVYGLNIGLERGGAAVSQGTTGRQGAVELP